MKSIRIGTRNSPLALWQAREVARHLQNLNFTTEIVPIVSSGDKNLTQPLYEMGFTGVFTKDLDIALLNDEIDVAVHSLKDVPTAMPMNIELITVLERDFPQDVLIRSASAKDKPLHELSIATSSLRRRAFWLREFPGTEFHDIRGNVQTRLEKIENGLADATIFSLAGIKRLGLNIDFEELKFMLPAPSQGVVAIAGKTGNDDINQIIKQIGDAPTQLCINIEREFLSALEGGCTAPIGAFAEIFDDKIRFRGRLCSPDGRNCIETEETIDKENMAGEAKNLAEKILAGGGREIMDGINKSR